MTETVETTGGVDSTATGAVATDATADPGYGGRQVCAIVGITYRQLDHWARTDLLRPSVADATGSGSRRRYAFEDVVQLKVIKNLLDGGQSLQSARRVIDCLRESGQPVGSANLVISGSTVALARNGEEMVDLVRGGQGVLSIVLELAGVVSEVEAAIRELYPAPPAAGAQPGPAGHPVSKAVSAAG